MAYKPFQFEEYKQIYSKITRLSVEVVLRTSKGVVLLLRKNQGWENMWHFAGGTVYFGESMEMAINRVAMEELGVKVKIIKFLDHLEFHDEERERGFGYTISAAFLCDLVEGALTHDEDSAAVGEFTEIPENTVIQHAELLRKHWDEIRKDVF